MREKYINSAHPHCSHCSLCLVPRSLLCWHWLAGQCLAKVQYRNSFGYPIKIFVLCSPSTDIFCSIVCSSTFLPSKPWQFPFSFLTLRCGWEFLCMSEQSTVSNFSTPPMIFQLRHLIGLGRVVSTSKMWMISYQHLQRHPRWS